MKLSIGRAASAGALLWGGGMLCAGALNLASPGYADAFLQVMASLYPGFHRERSWENVLVGAGYGFVDGGLAGLFFAWLYNLGLETT